MVSWLFALPRMKKLGHSYGRFFSKAAPAQCVFATAVCVVWCVMWHAACVPARHGGTSWNQKLAEKKPMLKQTAEKTECWTSFELLLKEERWSCNWNLHCRTLVSKTLRPQLLLPMMLSLFAFFVVVIAVALVFQWQPPLKQSLSIKANSLRTVFLLARTEQNS